MDYLVNEGYPSAAEKFAKEANIPTTTHVSMIQERVEIRNAIFQGDIQTAIERINELNPQVCITGPRNDSSTTCYDYLSFMHHS